MKKKYAIKQAPHYVFLEKAKTICLIIYVVTFIGKTYISVQKRLSFGHFINFTLSKMTEILKKWTLGKHVLIPIKSLKLRSFRDPPLQSVEILCHQKKKVYL
jgi:hypothetical protein